MQNKKIVTPRKKWLKWPAWDDLNVRQTRLRRAVLYPAELQADMKIIVRFESYCKRFLKSKQYQKQYLILFDYATIAIYCVLIVVLPLYIVVFYRVKNTLRRRMLYPTELRGQQKYFTFFKKITQQTKNNLKKVQFSPNKK